MLEQSYWIKPSPEMGDSAVSFLRRFDCPSPCRKAVLQVTAAGVYDVYLNDNRVGDALLTPGCTSYDRRLQVQTYDITALLKTRNELIVTVGKGWLRSRMTWKRTELNGMPCALIAQIVLTQDQGTVVIPTDSTWQAGASNVIFNDIWDGETCDLTRSDILYAPVEIAGIDRSILIPQEGEYVREQEKLLPRRRFVTPKGETVIDFGQEITGYVEVTLTAHQGDRVSLSCGEMLDRDGNFYNANYRTAQSCMTCICREGRQTWKPRFTFYGFRYIRLDEWPADAQDVSFLGVALYSDMKRTGFIRTTEPKLNRLIENSLWSQRGNFVDIPTDCPQRDERMGWTGDAQVFARAACYNYDTQQFFEKWLGDVRADQRPDGSIPDTVPNFWNIRRSSAAWGDVMTILPWQLYLMFGNRSILEKNFDAMRAWVDYITKDTLEPDLWIGPDDRELMWQKHYGDWLALDAEEGSYRGATPNDLIASAYYAYSVQLLVKAGRALGHDMGEYEALCGRIRAAFGRRFSLTTQTAHVLALTFDLTDRRKETAARLADMIRQNDNRLMTGFVGTPHLLYALSENGYTDVAYDLLLQEKYPSWLYEVNRGATTILEHWDGQKEDGTFWSTDMNSFNHYAYGAVVDWIYSVAAGIRPDETAPGFERAVIAPTPTPRIRGLEAAYRSVRGEIVSGWVNTDQGVRYEISTAVPANIFIAGRLHKVTPGRYVFYSESLDQKGWEGSR